ncbi:MAG: copper amine oxidase N-terminal domain-containing protein [Oscillospiraceae bacterium]|nr:copper amine oxidase N-terminal domain-containing protein [Oscillospiraceae bacterium]
MRKTEKIRYFILGVVFALILSTIAIPGLAAANYRQLNAYFNDIKIVIDGEPLEITTTDSDGNVVEPFSVAGRTYLPVGVLVEAFGYGAEYDGDTRTVYVFTPTDNQGQR